MSCSRARLIGGIVAILLGVVSLAPASEEPPVDFAADLARIHIESIGGAEKVAALKALRAVGTTRLSGGSLTFVMWAQRPNRVRVETTGGAIRITRGYDGVNAPWVRVGDKPAMALGGPDAADFVRDAEFDDPLYEPAAHGVTLEYTGEIEVHGLVWSRIRATGPGGVSVLYIDGDRMLVRRDIQRTIRGQEVTEETYFSDFRPVGGVLLPHLIEVRVGNNVLHETTLEHVDANPFMLTGFFSQE